MNLSGQPELDKRQYIISILQYIVSIFYRGQDDTTDQLQCEMVIDLYTN